MKWLEELKQLDPKNPGNWPWPFKIGAFALIFVSILIIAYFALYQGQLNDLDKEQTKEKGLKDTFLEKKKLAINLDAYAQQLKDIERDFGELLKQLPNKSEMDALLIDINQAGLGRGLQFSLFKPAPTENFTEFYAELPVTLKVTGSYHDFGAFASDVAKMSRIVLLNDIAISTGKEPAGKDSTTLTMDAIAKTYRYLDAEEIAKQRKTAKDAKAKTSPGKSGGK